MDIYESISEQLRALNVPERALFDSAGVLVNYILGVAGQNAANARVLASNNIDRSTFLAGVAAQWAQLDPARHPSVHRAVTQLRDHDDRAQFLAGVNLILAGIEAQPQMPFTQALRASSPRTTPTRDTRPPDPAT